MSSTTTTRKRGLSDLNVTDSERVTKKHKIDKEEQDDDDDEKSRNHIAIDDELKEIFSMNTSLFKDRYKAYKYFCKLSLALIRDFILVLKSTKGIKKKLYQFVEFEFYCLDYGAHPDVFAHCDELQLITSASWYFHRSGSNAIEGYQFMTKQKTKNKSAKWKNPRPNAKYRGGTFKGLDITFGAKNEVFGGILIRSLREVKKVNSAFSNCATYSPSDITEGPCNCVNLILKETEYSSIEELTASKQFNLSVFGDESKSIIYLDTSSKYNIKDLSPKRVQTKEESEDNIFEKYFYHSPRVGLTLKKRNGSKTNDFEALKREFLMAPYRCIRVDCLSKIKKYRSLIALSIVFKEYYRRKLNDDSSKYEHCQKDIDNALLLGPFKQKKLNQAIKDCNDGQTKEEKRKIIDNAVKKFPTNNSALCKLFGALM